MGTLKKYLNKPLKINIVTFLDKLPLKVFSVKVLVYFDVENIFFTKYTKVYFPFDEFKPKIREKNQSRKCNAGEINIIRYHNSASIMALPVMQCLVGALQGKPK